MFRRVGWFLIVLGGMACPASSRADQFDQLDGPFLARMIKGGDVTRRTTLTVPDLAAMPALLRDTRSALVLARTDRGNPARLLLTPEYRKPAGGQGEPIPVVVLERLDVFDASEPSNRISSRREMVIFDGFQVDLDTGQIVPEGQGGDLIFRVEGDQGPRLESIGSASLFTLAKSPVIDSSKVPQPTPGKAVVPGDFAGRYHLFADGQWSGTLDLKVEGRGVIVGQFRSDLHGTAYPVSGQVATDAAQKILFAVKYPRARQEFEGYLWAEGKGAIAGMASLNERPAGFFAIREGGQYAPAALDLGPLGPTDADRPGRHVVVLDGDTITLDGKPTTLDQLGEVARTLVGSEAGPTPWFMLQAPISQQYGRVRDVVGAIREAGVKSLRFGPREAEK